MRDTTATIEIDTEILDRLPARCDRRVEFIWYSITELKQELEAMGGGWSCASEAVSSER